MTNWKTTALGVLAIAVGVGAGILEHLGYPIDSPIVEAILGLIVGGGLIAAKDAK